MSTGNQPESARRRAEAATYTAHAERAKREMMAAIDTYVQAQVCVALAYERMERAQQKESNGE